MNGKRYQYLGYIAYVLLITTPALAQADKPNPLELTRPDPLLPQPPIERPISPLERSTLKTSLDELNAQADALLKAGDAVGAFEIWNRELRLRRVLGTLEEVQALGRVGEIAWNNTQKEEVELITGRLIQIQQQLNIPLPDNAVPRQGQPPATSRNPTIVGGNVQSRQTISPVKLDRDFLALRQALGKAYEQVRSPQQALSIYQQILFDARTNNDITAQETTLKTIGQLQMAYFDYPAAAATYEELLTMAQANYDAFNEVNYLQQLAYIYDKSKEPENALKAKQRLADSYLNRKDFSQIPALKIAIASDYEALDKPDEASQNYQEAYSLAVSIQQYAQASEALEKLSNLYRSHDQLDYALQILSIRAQINQRSLDFYGLMNTYDQIGQISVEQKNYPQALAAFQQGLGLAQSLKYQESYFTTQIARVNQMRSAPNP